jgi:hypothetical protein
MPVPGKADSSHLTGREKGWKWAKNNLVPDTNFTVETLALGNEEVFFMEARSQGVSLLLPRYLMEQAGRTPR